VYNFCLLSAKFVFPIVRNNINPTFTKSEGNMQNEGGHGLSKRGLSFPFERRTFINRTFQ